MNEPVLKETASLGKSRRMEVNPPVFFISAALTLAFALLGAVFARQAGDLFNRLQAAIVQDFGWFYIASVAGFLIFALFLMVSRFGDIKLGPDDCEPDYSYLSWFAMLFSAGMGIGLIFFGVAEPIQHYALPPTGEARTAEAAQQAMIITFFHWGFHAWAIYIIVGLALAYFAFRRGLPLTIRSALYPLIGRHIYGPAGHAIDIFAVLGTMFGVATSLGLGVLQVNAGLSYLVGLPATPAVQIGLITVITAFTTITVAMGLDRGIKRLAELNIILAVLLLCFVLFTGATIFLLQAFVQNIGAYLSDAVQRTFRMYAYDPNPWLGNWTLFYWGWWIAWSPFVGMFIARISRGRTIREFVTGVLLVPGLFTFLWMTVFGNTAIALDMSGAAPIADTVANNLPVALFEMLGQLPFVTISSALATLLIVTFFVTSANSGALVIDLITSGAAENPPVWQRIFWAVLAGAVASVLLVAGGLQALQTASIVGALPFAMVMILMCIGLLRALRAEVDGSSIDYAIAGGAVAGAGMSWQQRLASIVRHPGRTEVCDFLKRTGRPALDEIAAQMGRNGLAPEIAEDGEHIALTVPHGELGAFNYTVRLRGFRAPNFAWTETPEDKGGEGERHYYRAMAHSSEGDQPHDVTGFGREQLIHDILNRYAHFRHARRMQ